MTEQSIQSAIQKLITTEFSGYVTNVITANKSGTPDLIACIDGVYLGLEVKKPGGILAPLQQYHLDLINESGGHAAAVYSVDDARSFIQQHIPKYHKEVIV